MTVTELYELVKEFKKDFKDFKKNDFYHLECKVDKIATKVAWIAGGFFVLTVVVNVLIRIL